MAKPIRLLISDVDGTLVRHDKTLSDATIAAAHRLLDGGIGMTLISARPATGVQPLAEKLGVTLPFGAYNGGTLIKPDGTIVEQHRVDPGIAAEILRLTVESGAHPWIFADGRWHVTTLDEPHIDREKRSALQDPVVVETLDHLLDRVDKLVSVSDDSDLLHKLQDRARAAAGGQATVAMSQTYYLDTTALQANKGDGVTALAKAAGVALEEVAVIGDMPNDLPMFARAGLAIAMGQAPDEVKAKAAAVSTGNDEDGVAHAIDTILLPQVRGKAA